MRSAISVKRLMKYVNVTTVKNSITVDQHPYVVLTVGTVLTGSLTDGLRLAN